MDLRKFNKFIKPAVKKHRIISVVIIGLIIFISGLILYRHYQQKAANTLTLFGNIEIRDVALSFRVSGRIDKMLFEEGDRVNKETVIAALAQDTFIDELEMAKAELAEAVAMLKNNEVTYKRYVELLKTHNISQADYDKQFSELEKSRASVQVAKAQVKRAETTLQDTILRSPSPGIILTRIREPGAIVNATQPVYILALDKPVWVRAFVAEPSLGRIHQGQLVTIYTDTEPNKSYAGQIGFISPQAEFTPKNVETAQLRTDLVYRLRIIIAAPDKSLLQGMPVTVKITSSRVNDEQ